MGQRAQKLPFPPRDAPCSRRQLYGKLSRAPQDRSGHRLRPALLPVIDAVRQTGARSIGAISRALNQRGIRTARGGKWHVSSVANLLARARAPVS